MTLESEVERLLARIAAREPAVKAWAYLDPAQSLAEARRLDRLPDPGPLYGLTVGVKDAIDTADMPTEYNSPIYRDHRPAADAACVARLRRAGALILGKTTTTEFAFAHPAPTTNPHDSARTPGGSSSGSAAAAAAGMVATALGSQTGGSTIRPAAFCGVYALKPSFDLIDPKGLKPLAKSLDTIGIYARKVDDLRRLVTVMADETIEACAATPPSFALCRTPFWAEASAAMQTRLEEMAGALEAAGAKVRELSLPASFSELNPIHQTVMAFETARAYVEEWKTARDQLSDEFQALLERGRAIGEDDYRRAVASAGTYRESLDGLLAADEIILTPSAAGEAPKGLTHTGNPIFNRLWTLLHVPCLHVPYGRGPAGLPLGVQLVARRGADADLLAAGAWCATHLRGAGTIDVD